MPVPCFGNHMPRKLFSLKCLLLFSTAAVMAADNRAPIPEDIPDAIALAPKMEQPVFAVCSKQGMRILVSRDDGETWEQTFLGTPEREDGGWHGNFAVYGMAYTEGVIGVFSGWGAPGVYIGSDDGVTWGHLNSRSQEVGSVWGATAGGGRMLTSADQWRGLTISRTDFSGWEKVGLRDLLDGGKTHHIICGYGDYGEGTFVAVGDNQQVFYSNDLGETWAHTTIAEEAGGGQNGVAFSRGIFVVAFKEVVARSEDGGATWTLHPHGLEGRQAWRALSVVNGKFWLTARDGERGRWSADGIAWEDLPEDLPGGKFIQGETGTVINVERGRNDIRRSTDQGRTWSTVFTAPTTAKDDPTWNLALATYGKVNPPGS